MNGQTNSHPEPSPVKECAASTRRDFLPTLAALGTITILPSGSWFAQTPGAGTKLQLIDVHHHIFPPAFLAATPDALPKWNRCVDCHCLDHVSGHLVWGNFTKVVQRIQVKIVFDDSNVAATLRPGLSVIATVRTRR